MIIKHLARAVIPSPLRPSAKRVYRLLKRRNQPRFDPSVLQCRVAYNVHGGYCVPLSSRHLPMVQAILAGEVFEPETIEFLESYPGAGDLVHAGAFFGDFLPALSRSRRASDKVWAFEPNFESYRCASITLAINNLSNVELANAALGDRDETGFLMVRNLNGLSLGSTSRVLDRAEKVAISERNVQVIRLVKLDSVIPTNVHVSAIHLDVEGYETDALNGARNIIRQCRPVIIVETMPNPEWLSNNLWPLGYRIGPKIHYNTVLIHRDGPPNR